MHPKQFHNLTNPEAKLQSEIVIDFSQRLPEYRGRLFASMSEMLASTRGGYYRSLGLVEHLADLMYVDDSGFLVPIELKFPLTRHSKNHVQAQAEMLLKWTKTGWFCDSKEMFWEIINGGQGIDPHKVIAYLENHRAATFKWDSSSFL